MLDACKAASNTRSTATECESDLDCCGAPTTSICSLQKPIASPPKRHCIPKASSGCIADNAATPCSADAQCCGFSSGSRCANGTCQQPTALTVFSEGTFMRDFVAANPGLLSPQLQAEAWAHSYTQRARFRCLLSGEHVPAIADIGRAIRYKPTSSIAWRTLALIVLTALGWRSRS